MSMFKDYVKERLPNSEVIETEEGFIYYHVFGTECYIEDIYIKPEYRGMKISREFEAMVISQVEGICDCLTATVNIKANGAAESYRKLIGAGYEAIGTRDSAILFQKELSWDQQLNNQQKH